MPVSLRPGPLLSVILAFAGLSLSVPASSEVRVAGRRDAVSIEARDASVEEVLGRLDQSFGVRHRSTVPLHRRVTATYTGPLEVVLRRLLEGYDFVVETKADDVQVLIIGFVRQGGAEPGLIDPGAQPPPRRRAD